MFRSARLTLGIAAALALGSVLLAWLLQRFFDMQPCAWCVLQRLVYLAVGALALAALALRGGLRNAMTSFAAIMSLAGLAAALYQQFVAAKSVSCNLSFADRVIGALKLDSTLPALFSPTANCMEANLPLLGLPFALWSAALFALLAVLCITALRARR
jgi:disulfide bond formation protein DsbB